MADDRQTPQDDPRASGNGNGKGGDRPELDRLPPPAFPPGQRSAHRRNVRLSDAGQAGGEEGVPDDAFISPDDPIVRTGTRIASDAFISPDEPIARRDPLDTGDDDLGADEGMVTGIGDDAHLGRRELALTSYADEHVADIVMKVGRLADALRERGEAGLKTTPDMSRFEATMRAYCVGYLAAQRDAGKD